MLDFWIRSVDVINIMSNLYDYYSSKTSDREIKKWIIVFP